MTLKEIFDKHKTDKGSHVYDKNKPGHNYDSAYVRILEEIRYEEFNLLEIGVRKGHSIRAWLEYFPNANIYGVDIEQYPEIDDILWNPRFHFALGDSRKDNPFEGVKFDVIIDDGCHKLSSQVATYDTFKDNIVGCYIIEDVTDSKGIFREFPDGYFLMPRLFLV